MLFWFSMMFFKVNIDRFFISYLNVIYCTPQKSCYRYIWFGKNTVYTKKCASLYALYLFSVGRLNACLSELFHWNNCNLTIATLRMNQPCWVSVNTSHECTRNSKHARNKTQWNKRIHEPEKYATAIFLTGHCSKLYPSLQYVGAITV